MRIEIKRLTSWKDCLESARFTQGKFNKVTKEPSTKWKIMALYSEHSPIRELKFHIDIFDVPNFTLTHLVRHIHTQPFVSTMREDLTGIKNEDVTRNTPNHMRWSLNAQSIIDIMKLRLCNKASKETRDIANKIKEKFIDTGETELANVGVKTCVYRGFCPEYKPCGYTKTEKFKNEREMYIKNLEDLRSE